MIDSSIIIDDPSELFTQFDPNLYFSDPKLDDTYLTSNLNWYTIVEQSVPTDQEAFWKTIKRWTNEPQLIIPPIEKIVLLSNIKNDNKQSEESINPFETITRQLVPKRKSKDPLLSETVTYYENNLKGRVIYKPCVNSIIELPFYYPKVSCQKK
ncbi:hypothetical protein BJ944DRAFT_204291 [Cunninghamella echinulata]|nr:hypothetical protein BJ944DRAFT_204291 [Cunninghamella echinulata]